MTGAATTTGVGLTLPQLGPHVTRDAVRAFCESAEALGFTSTARLELIEESCELGPG